MGTFETGAGAANWLEDQDVRKDEGDQPELNAEEDRDQRPYGSDVAKLGRRAHAGIITGLVVVQVVWMGLLSYAVYELVQFVQ